MKKLNRWKIILILLLVFGAGAVTGSMVTHEVIKRGLDRAMKFETWKTGVMKVLQAKLKLSPEQHSKVEAILGESGLELKAVFAKGFNESGHIFFRMDKRIDQELTAEQRAIHEQMGRDFRAHLKKQFDLD